MYRGEVELTVALEREGGWRGRPVLVMRYQPCTETECREAMAAELDIRLLGA